MLVNGFPMSRLTSPVSQLDGTVVEAEAGHVLHFYNAWNVQYGWEVDVRQIDLNTFPERRPVGGLIVNSGRMTFERGLVQI